MSAHLALGPGPEFDVIRAIAARLGAAAPELGDDCALVSVGGATLAVTIDASLEDVHFRRAWLSPEEIGWRAAAAALSDLAAEGAAPIGVVVSLGLPAAAVDEAPDVMAGVAAAAGAAGAAVLGGDLVRAERRLVDVCALGTVERPVRRRGARVGDGVWVTGSLGGAGLALVAHRAGTHPAPELAARFARPQPRVAAGRWLAGHGASAMIDVSDGLAADARHLAAASGVAVEIDLERVPCWPGVPPVDALASGEEYELCVALAPEFGEREAAAFAAAAGVALTRVGWCAAGSGLRLRHAGREVPAPPGYDHFAAP